MSRLALVVAVFLASFALCVGQEPKDAPSKIKELTPEEREAIRAKGEAIAGVSACAIIGFIVVGLVALAINLIPVVIAMFRGHPDTVAIAAVTFLLGWTGVGWILAFIWSVKSFPRNRDGDARDY